MDTISWLVSKNLHRDAVQNILHAKMSFFDTTVSWFTILSVPRIHLASDDEYFSPQVVFWVSLERILIVGTNIGSWNL